MFTALLLAIAAVPLDDPGKKDLEKLQGVWKAPTVESRGASFDVTRVGETSRYTLVVVGDRYVLGTYGGTLKVGPKGEVDLVVTEGPRKGITRLGRYELAGDTLKLAVAGIAGGEQQARPTEMKTDQTNLHTLYNFAREKATKEEVEAKLKEMTAAANRPARGVGGAPQPDPTTTLLRQVIERLDRIEKRLDAIEKQGRENK